MPALRAILVGLGGRGRHWLAACRGYDGVEVAAVVEPDETNRRRAIDDLDVVESLMFEDLAAAATAVEADFVVDVTPPAVHEQVAMAAFQAGLHVLGEKPLCGDYEAARRIVEAGGRSGLRHMITQNYRFNGLPRTTHRLLGEGLIGDCAQLDVSLYVNWADNPGSHYVTEPYMFLTDMGIHHFDMMRYTLGREPLSVRALTWNLPWGWHQGDAAQLILFRFEGDVVVTHRGVGCTVGHVPAGHNGEWRYEGPAGTLTWEGMQLFHTHAHKADPKVREEVPLDDVGPEDRNPVLHEFVSSIQQTREPECSAADNLRSMAMVFGALRSAREDGVEVLLSDL
jgi:predicted dehydrogenase